MNTTELGAFGEALAESHLLKNGYTILDKNIRFKKWEVDIVALQGEKLVIVEVKTRQTAEIGEPWRAVTRSKQKQIIKVADNYIRTRNIDKETRFDVISIVHNSYRTQLEHLEEAFYPLV
jgi:putative endonuclease